MLHSAFHQIGPRIVYGDMGPFRTPLSVIYFNAEGTYIYHIVIKRQMIELYSDIINIKMGKRLLLKLTQN